MGSRKLDGEVVRLQVPTRERGTSADLSLGVQ